MSDSSEKKQSREKVNGGELYTPVNFRNTELKIRILLIFFLILILPFPQFSAYTTSSRIMDLKYHILQWLSASQDRNRIFLFVINLPATF